ncbi:MAG: penicillin-binding transpeptidase domain-containing protein [Anaerolineales bacterium]|nr:penicillin-binding transpeptidase domain-containing protein [Anaerolineales bacterium]
MKNRYWLLALVLVLLSSCARASTGSNTPTIEPTPTLGEPSVGVTSVPDVKAAARAYLEAWVKDDYDSMYGLLTTISQGAMSAEDFAKHYRGVATEAALSAIEYEILSSLVLNPERAQVNYRVTLHSSLVGDISRSTVMNLTREKGQWRVEWDDSLVLPELAGGNYLAMERYVPSRGNIYDREGHALVAQNEVTAIGLIPGQIIPEQEESLFDELVRLTGLRAETIRERYAAFPPGSDWYLPLVEVPSSEVARRYDILSGLSGLRLSLYKARYYYDGGIAPHVIGYVSTIQAEEEEAYLRKGYRRDERVGQSGLEQWGEEYLSGKRGGALYVFNSQGQPVTRLGEVQPQPANAVYTTLSRDFQVGVQQALTGFRGAIVVMERDTGRVLAMVSSPKFDPNAFEPSNFNSYTLLNEIFNDPARPYLNRASQGLYPLGSVFKLVTLAAALESGRYTPQTTYQCGYFFEELVGVTLNDWTYDHFLQDGETIPSGLLTLPEGLIRSCNPFFWHIGLDLYNAGMTTSISDMARNFGLGKLTGIEGVEEESGQVPDPASQLDATNLAIGQGALLVTPLQVATFTAALGNGGTLYQPQVVEKVAPPDGDPVVTFEPKETGKLPVSAENLAVIQDAMHGVVASTKPFGTAWHRFTGLDILVAGKTGTATSGSGEPHAWFAGYTFENRPNQPDIAAVVIVENAGEGSDYAAPIFRRVVELYFYGLPGKLYPWESGYYITQTPTPEGFETPTPEPALPLPPMP